MTGGIVYRDSLQNFDLYTNHARCIEGGKQTQSYRKAAKLKGLAEVLEHLQLPVNNDNKGSVKGYMKFDVAYEIFSGHQEGPVCENTFLDALGHPEHRLFVYIADMPISTNLSSRFIILKRPTLNLMQLLDEVQKHRLNQAESIMGRQETQSIIKSMDTEWDKTCAKVLSAANKSIEEIRELGFDPDTMPSSIRQS